jgi:histidyl-tRNA synthetase
MEACRDIVMHLDLKEDYLCTDCKEHFHNVREGLNLLKINYQVLPYLVRGLDYYTRTVFEITHKDLGSQDAIGAGGRYDNLVKELGGPDVGAVGFALGMERILLVKKYRVEGKDSKLIFLVTLGKEAKKEGIKLLDFLRKNKIQAETDYQDKSLKAAMRRADDLGVRFVIIIGEDELRNKVVTLKDMASGEQKEINSQELLKEIAAIC